MEYSEYSQVQPVEISSKEWQFVRIAHLANPLGLPVHLGVYAAAPSKQVGLALLYHSSASSARLPARPSLLWGGPTVAIHASPKPPEPLSL